MSYTTRYLHNQKLLVIKGMAVTQGQPIALLGSTGESSGPHVHFDMAVTMPEFRDTLDHPSDLLEVGRALPGCGGRLAVPVEQFVAWVHDRAPGKWPPLLVEDTDFILPIDPATPKLRLGSCWYARRKTYTAGKNADGSAKYAVDAQGNIIWRRHQGVDLGGVKIGTPVLASAAGIVVVASKNSPSAGNWIVIEHP
jgi:murein DD-endopeptidase MepM/ murein hydrolase activator NlpD